jgi:LysM repeat protein
MNVPKCCTIVLLLAVVACQGQSTIPSPVPTLPQSTPTSTVIPPTSTPSAVVYVVQAGDSLSAIAVRFEVSLDALAEANGIEDANVIKVGQQLVIPGPTSIPTATIPPTITPTVNVPPEFEIIDVIGRGAPTTETVVLVNRGKDVSLYQWTLRDAQGNVFFFPKLYVATGAEIRVHTTSGQNTPQHLYWNRNAPVWEETGDTVILADPRGVVYASKALN